MTALPADERPTDPTPVHTAELPATPLRDRNIPVSAWIEAPQSLRSAGDELPGAPEAMYKRRIGPWLLWRAGPAKGDAVYIAIAADDLTQSYVFRIFADKTGSGLGASGASHARFRTWKEDLRDHPPAG